MSRRYEPIPVSLRSVRQSVPGPPFPPPAPPGPASSRLEEDELWEGPTLKELVERVEHQFGQTPALAGVFTLGFGRDEPLTPGDIRAVCDHLGLPATDFGLDPR